MGPGRLEWIVLAALGLLLLVECGLADRADAPTYDETTHLPAGYLHLVRGDYRWQVDHPPLAKMLAAAAALLAGARAPAEPPPAWRADLLNRFDHRPWGWRFLYGTAGNDPDLLVSAGRRAIALFALLTLVVTWAWTRDLLGPGPALGVASLAVLDPNLIAHGHLVTADVPVTALMAATLYVLWRALRRWRASTAALAGLLLGLALATKYTAGLLVPVVALAAVGRVLAPAPWPAGRGGHPVLDRRGPRLRTALALLIVVLVVAWGTLWACYRFRAAPAPGGAVGLTEAARAVWFPGPRPWAVDLVADAARDRVVPDAWAFGLLYLAADRRLTPQSTYLGGRLSPDGWWYYFPAALALKVPLPTLGLAALGLATAVAAGRQRPAPAGHTRAELQHEAGRWGVALLGATSITILVVGGWSPHQTGLRQVLPVYPALLVAAGAGIAFLARRGRSGRAAVAAALLWAAAGSATVAPRYLTYFNEAAGGPARGHRWLVDSNLDWGQALRELPPWLAARGIDQVHLGYFGTADPDAYGLRYATLPGGTSYSKPPSAPRVPGHVAISATHLAGVHLPPDLRAWYRSLLARAELIGVVGHAIHVYRVPAPP